MRDDIFGQEQGGYVVLASCFGDEDTGGGLFSFDGRTIQRIDWLSSTGLSIAGNRLLRLLRCPDETGSVGELLVYDPRGVERYYRIDLLSDAHGITWDGSHFIVASTATNGILWISPSGEVERRWQASGEGDCWHLNSLFMRNGQLFVSAFGRFQRHREWADKLRDASGFILNLTTGEEVLTGLSCPHSPQFFEGAWILCNSATREVLEIEALTGSIRRRLQLNGWTRGIAIFGELLLIGESALRHDPSPGLATASIAVVCRKTFSLLDRISLPCREIYDLVVAPASLVEGVQRGFRTNDRRVAEQAQYAMFEQVGVQPLRLWATGDPLPPEACKIKIEASVPSVLTANALVELECVIENLGTALFVSAPPNPVHISYRWIPAGLDPSVQGIEGMRSRLPQALRPYQPVVCRFKVVAPQREGEFILRLTLVQEDVAWFDALDEANSCSQLVHIVKVLKSKSIRVRVPSRAAARGAITTARKLREIMKSLSWF